MSVRVRAFLPRELESAPAGSLSVFVRPRLQSKYNTRGI